MSSAEFVHWFADVGIQDRPRVGGKGGSLGELQNAGIGVPPGFVVGTAAFETCIAALEHAFAIRAQVEALDADDLEAIGVCSQQLRALVEEAPLPAEVLTQIETAHARLCADAVATAVAVRSSATTEDALDASFAGLQDTFLWVQGANHTVQMVRRCWASLYSVESISYRRRKQLPEAGVAMAVVVQVMVDARTAGVLFTRSPTTGDRSVITIEGAWGLGSAVVGGEVTPDRWVMGKITGEISVRDISDKAIRHVPVAAGGIEELPVDDALRTQPCMTDSELEVLRGIARKVEKHYGHAQDIEWAVDRHTGSVWLLQSRPETVWSAQAASPVARPADDPLAHVMAIFGGRR